MNEPEKPNESKRDRAWHPRLVRLRDAMAALGEAARRHRWAVAILATITFPIWIAPFAVVGLIVMVVSTVKLAIFGDDDDTFSY